MREYFHKTRHLTITAANNALLSKMSPALQGEVLWRNNHVWLRRVTFLRRCDPEFIARVLLSLQPLVFAPSDVVFGTALYILHHGVAVYGGRVLTAGAVWGEDMLLANSKIRSQRFARALNYVEALSIEREPLLELTLAFPKTLLSIRVYIGMLALRRTIVAMAREERTQRKLLGLSSDQRTPFLEAFFAAVQTKLLTSGKDGQSAKTISPFASVLSEAQVLDPGLSTTLARPPKEGGSSFGKRHGPRRRERWGDHGGDDDPPRSHRGDHDEAQRESPPPRGGSIAALIGNRLGAVDSKLAALDEQQGGMHSLLSQLVKEVAELRRGDTKDGRASPTQNHTTVCVSCAAQQPTSSPSQHRHRHRHRSRSGIQLSPEERRQDTHTASSTGAGAYGNDLAA